MGLCGFGDLVLTCNNMQSRNFSLGAALVAQFRRHDPLMRGMSFAAIMSVTAILIHSTVDFNLQIPANAATFMLLLALAWISLHLRELRPPRKRRPSLS